MEGHEYSNKNIFLSLFAAFKCSLMFPSVLYMVQIFKNSLFLASPVFEMIQKRQKDSNYSPDISESGLRRR
jgi:hypothetical protein